MQPLQRYQFLQYKIKLSFVTSALHLNGTCVARCLFSHKLPPKDSILDSHGEKKIVVSWPLLIIKRLDTFKFHVQHVNFNTNAEKVV